jgi:hypothetical protein
VQKERQVLGTVVVLAATGVVGDGGKWLTAIVVVAGFGIAGDNGKCFVIVVVRATTAMTPGLAQPWHEPVLAIEEQPWLARVGRGRTGHKQREQTDA